MGIKEHFTSTELPVYVIMPNHLHGVIIIKDTVGARHAVPANSVKPFEIPISESFGKPVRYSLPTIIRSLKAAVTKQINTSREDRQSPFWQRGYYEHVIRDEKEFIEIAEYILGNPLKWDLDRENPYGIKTVKPLPFEY
jgi:REP element-mobilizing transposase RayT